VAYAGAQGEAAGIENDSWMGVYRSLFPTSVPLDFVHVSALDGLSQYKLVILPYPLMLPASAAAPLREYVRQGGTLVAEARMGWSNESGAASDRIPGMGLWEVMGCRESAVQTGAAGRTTLVWGNAAIPGLKAGESLPARWYEETLEPLGGSSRVVARFANGDAAAVASTYGRGKTLMLGSYVSAAYATHPSGEAERFYAGLLEWSGVSLPVTGVSRTVEVRTLETGRDTLVFVFNHGSEVEANIGLRMAAGSYHATDVVENRAVEAAREGEFLRLRKSLPKGGVWVVRLAAL
jgi:beta-galactosidase